MKTATGSNIAKGGLKPQILAAVGNAVTLVRAVAQPSFVQFVLRVALAVPFWRSGILKWSGFLQLNDTAILLFSDEFKLHLPGGPYSFPVPGLMAFMSGSDSSSLRPASSPSRRASSRTLAIVGAIWACLSERALISAAGVFVAESLASSSRNSTSSRAIFGFIGEA